MFAFNLLRVALAHGMRRCGQGSFIDASSICIEVLQAKGLQELPQLDKDFIRATTKGVREDYLTQMINRMPQPPLVRFALYETPHLIDLSGFDASHFDRDRLRTTPLHDACVDPGQPGGFFLIREARY